MLGIYTYIPETSYVHWDYSVAAILLLLFMVLIIIIISHNLSNYSLFTATCKNSPSARFVSVFCTFVLILCFICLFFLAVQ